MKDEEIESIFLEPGEVQKLLGIGATLFYQLVRTDGFPKPRKSEHFKRPRFLRSEIISWGENLPLDTTYFNDGEEA